jgi:HK97 family phage major capsid protein
MPPITPKPLESDDPKVLREYANELGRTLVTMNETIENERKTAGEKFEAYEKQMADVQQQVAARDKLASIMNASSPYILPNLSIRDIVKTEGFFTRSKRGPMDAQDQRVLDFQTYHDRLASALLLWRHFHKQDNRPEDVILRTQFPQTFKMFDGLRKEFTRAMDSTTATEGLEYCPTGMSAQLWEKYRMALRVAAMFPSFPLPTNPYEYPNEGADVEAYGVSEATDDTGTATVNVGTPKTAKITFTAKDIAAGTLHSRQLTDKSIINILDYIMRKHTLAHSVATETGFVNGDVTTVHMDQDTTNPGTGTNCRKLWIGLRFMGLNNGTPIPLSTFDDDHLMKIPESMGKYGIVPNASTWLAGIKTYFRMLKLEQLRTWDKYGPMATVVTGEIAKYAGHPLIVSEYMREDLADTGKYETAGAHTFGTILLVYPEEFNVGTWQPFETVTARELFLRSLQVYVQSYQSLAFQCMVAYATDRVVGCGYGIDLSL